MPPDIPNFDDWVATRKPKPDVDSALNLISKYESGGRNIKQQIVPPGGGYNPSVGRVTGPSTAGGPWQITNTTWQKRAPREIVQKYPTAMSAPVDVQRSVAGKIFQETGFQDWAPYNAALRRAIARGETGQQPSQIPDFDTWAAGQQGPSTQPAPVRPARPKSWGTGTIGQGVKTTRISPRGISAARVEGEAQPSEATSMRGGLQGIARMAGLPTQIPSEAGDFINQMVAEGTAGLMQRGAGLALQAPGLPMGAGAPVAERLQQGAQQIQQGSQAIDKDTQRASVNVPVLGNVSTKDVQSLGSGVIASAPALILQRMGVPGPLAFGLDAYLASTGRGEAFNDVMKETGLAGLSGVLYEIPLSRRIGLVGQIAAKLGIGGAGGYGLAKAFGLPEPEARKFAAQTGVMMAAGARGREPSALSRGLDREITRESLRAKTEIRGEGNQAVLQSAQPIGGGTVQPSRHVDLQRRLDDGTFGKETKAEAEARKAQVESATPATPEPAPEELIRPPETAPSPAEQPPLAATTPERATTAPIPEVKTPKLALGVEAKAVEAKLTKGFEDLPEYQTINVADQAARATDLLKSNPERAKRIAMGDEMPDGDLLPESVFTAVENHALKNGDIETIRDLATASSRPGEASVMGQRIRMLAERNPSSAVNAIRDIQVAREARAQRTFGKNGADKIKTEIQVEVRRAAPKAKDWASFLEEIKCK